MKYLKSGSMKKVLALLGFSGLISACDYVPNAVQSTQTITSSRKVLIEDYTGHKCGNCPAAARELRKLDSIYAGKIVPIAVHAGFYAKVTPLTNPPYPTDLNSTPSTDYDNFFGNSSAGNPNGLVNRSGYGTANFIKQWTDWGTAAYSYFSSPADFILKITNTVDSVNNRINTTVTTKAAKTKTGTYNLVILLTEDNIVAEQIDYSLPAGSQYMTNYVFNHVLRDALNTSWGSPIITTGMVAGDSVVKTISNYQLSSNWRWKNCNVVAFVYDAKSGSPTQYEVLQAEEKALK